MSTRSQVTFNIALYIISYIKRVNVAVLRPLLCTRSAKWASKGNAAKMKHPSDIAQPGFEPRYYWSVANTLPLRPLRIYKLNIYINIYIYIYIYICLMLFYQIGNIQKRCCCVCYWWYKRVLRSCCVFYIDLARGCLAGIYSHIRCV